jgi:hypothetical protein
MPSEGASVKVMSGLKYYCNRPQPDSATGACMGLIEFGPGQLMACCPECGQWTGAWSDRITEVPKQSTGATRGTAHRIRVLPVRYADLRLRCGDPECHWTDRIKLSEFELALVIKLANEHPCPKPAEAMTDLPGEKVETAPNG